jgi:GAF domain-containing protein
MIERAEDTITRQAEEIERLRGVLDVAAAAGVIGSPVTHARLLEMIVETGASVIGVRAGALFLLDEVRGDLTFEVAIGPKAAEVRQLRVPLGHGVAGMVALSGQAMAISDAGGDPRFATDIAEGVGYIPQTLLCVPLFYGERVIGALELLDKHDGGTFTAADIDAAARFANIAAVALQLSRTYQHVGAHLGSADGREGAAGAEDDPDARDAFELAALVQEIINRGESERRACREILLGFAGYLRAPARSGDEAGVEA